MTDFIQVPAGTWDCFSSTTFTDQVALITGGGGGMGERIATAFHDLGATVVITDIDAGLAETVALKLGDRAEARALDVSDPDQVADTFEYIDGRHGRIDHVVSCAAIMTANRTPEITRSSWDRVMNINLLGTFLVCQQALQRMTGQHAGHIVAIASDAGKRGGGGLIADAAYAASKAGVLSLVKSLAREHAGAGVSINALTPGPTDTPMHDTVSSDLKERIAASVPLHRMGHPDDMAAAVMFLCSPASRFVYGASLNVDGGSLFE